MKDRNRLIVLSLKQMFMREQNLSEIAAELHAEVTFADFTEQQKKAFWKRMQELAPEATSSYE